SLGHRVHDRMREAEREVQLVALSLRAVADPDQGKALLEALGHPEHHVRRERAQSSRHGVRLVGFVERLEHELVAVLLDLHVPAQSLRHGSERSLDRQRLGRKGCFDALRQRDWIFCDSRHGYATMQMTSPPTPVARALRSVMTPLEVETMATPSPFMMRGSSS